MADTMTNILVCGYPSVETAEQADALIQHWSEMEGVECTIDDLSAHHAAGEVLEADADAAPLSASPSEDQPD